MESSFKGVLSYTEDVLQLGRKYYCYNVFWFLVFCGELRNKMWTMFKTGCALHFWFSFMRWFKLGGTIIFYLSLLFLFAYLLKEKLEVLLCPSLAPGLICIEKVPPHATIFMTIRRKIRHKFCQKICIPNANILQFLCLSLWFITQIY